MAGTRLLIQGTLVVELFLLVGLAFYFGLCHNHQEDVVCRPLFGQAGRSKLVLPKEWEEQTPMKRTSKEDNPFSKRYSLHVTLVLEEGVASDWSSWSSALDQWVSQYKQESPCLRGSIETELFLAPTNLSDSATVKNMEEGTEYHVNAKKLRTTLNGLSYERAGGSQLQVYLYIPNNMPMMVVKQNQKPATAFIWEQQLVTVVNKGDRAASVQHAMEHVESLIQKHCAISSFESVVNDTHERAKQSVLKTRNIMLQLSYKVAITNEAAQRWRKSMDLVETGLRHAQESDFEAALEHLEASLDISRSLLTDPTLFEPVDLSWDHYLAIFAPLLFPLLLPFVAGLVREVKRYKKLRN